MYVRVYVYMYVCVCTCVCVLFSPFASFFDLERNDKNVFVAVLTAATWGTSISAFTFTSTSFSETFYSYEEERTYIKEFE